MTLSAPDNLACPLCTTPLRRLERQWVCDQNHSFDLARQGYLNLLPVQHKKSRTPGDSKAMVAARQAFLDSGLYLPIARELVRQVRRHLPPVPEQNLSILDAGCGEGYYLDYLVQAISDATDIQPPTVSAVGLDISKDAIIAASKRYPAPQWIVGTNVHPPIQSGTLDVLLCLFGFPSFAHFRPLLREHGVIIMADPGPEHLIELRELIYPEVRRPAAREATEFAQQGLILTDSDTLEFKTPALNQARIQDLLAMTPHLYRASHAGKQAVAALETLTLTVQVVFRVLRKHNIEEPALSTGQ